MEMKDKFYFNYWLADFLEEEIFNAENETTVSFTSAYTQKKEKLKEDVIVELMIFLEKEDQGFKVRIYKSSLVDKYIPHCLDKVTKYISTNEYDDFFFDSFENAKYFIIFLAFFHIEYQERPIRKLKQVILK